VVSVCGKCGTVKGERVTAEHGCPWFAGPVRVASCDDVHSDYLCDVACPSAQNRARGLGLCFVRSFLLRLLRESFGRVQQHGCLRMHVTRECGVPCRTWWWIQYAVLSSTAPRTGWGVHECWKGETFNIICCKGETSRPLTFHAVKVKLLVLKR
jgi:hypothetical protein